MTIGQGNVFVISRSAQSGAPFAAGAANNGLSVDAGTGKIVLGDDVGLGGLAQLISARNIDLNGFNIALLHLFGDILFNLSNITIDGDETNLFPSQIILNDVNDPNNQGLISILPSVGRTIYANLNFAGGNITGIGCERNRVAVSKSLGGAPLPDTGALLQIDSSLSTGDPGSGQGVWKLGKKVAGAVALDAANYVEVDIDGAIVKLGIVV